MTGTGVVEANCFSPMDSTSHELLADVSPGCVLPRRRRAAQICWWEPAVAIFAFAWPAALAWSITGLTWAALSADARHHELSHHCVSRPPPAPRSPPLHARHLHARATAPRAAQQPRQDCARRGMRSNHRAGSRAPKVSSGRRLSFGLVWAGDSCTRLRVSGMGELVKVAREAEPCAAVV